MYIDEEQTCIFYLFAKFLQYTTVFLPEIRKYSYPQRCCQRSENIPTHNTASIDQKIFLLPTLLPEIRNIPTHSTASRDQKYSYSQH